MNKKVFTDLKRFRCSTRDAAYAACVAHYLRLVHLLVFPDSKIHISFALESQNASWVGYADRRLHPDQDVYCVTVRGLFRALTRYQTSLDPPPPPAFLFMAVAVHEVRHRLQFVRPDLRLYSTHACTEPCRWLDVCGKVRARRRSLLASLRRDGFHSRLAREKADENQEFDASFVEYLALRGEPRTDAEIRGIVLSEPPPLHR